MGRPGRKSKDIANASVAGANALDIITSGADTKSQKTKPGFYRMSVTMPVAYKDYLHAATYYSSGPNNYVSITEYMCRLIDEDMKKHPDWIEGNKNAIKEKE